MNISTPVVNMGFVISPSSSVSAHWVINWPRLHMAPPTQKART
jgi:hypothetical protein